MGEIARTVSICRVFWSGMGAIRLFQNAKLDEMCWKGRNSRKTRTTRRKTRPRMVWTFFPGKSVVCEQQGLPYHQPIRPVCRFLNSVWACTFYEIVVHCCISVTFGSYAKRMGDPWRECVIWMIASGCQLLGVGDHLNRFWEYSRQGHLCKMSTCCCQQQPV